MTGRLGRLLWCGAMVCAMMLACTVSCRAAEPIQMLFHAGAGQRSSLMDISKLFEKKFPNVEINFSFKGSGYFLADIERSHEGDLYMPGEEFYLLQAVERGFADAYDPVKDVPAYFMTVIIVPKGNPAKIQKIEDFARPGLKVSLGNPKACAIGIWHEKIFIKAGIWDQVKKNEAHSAKCIPEVATAVQQKVADASIVWATTAVLYLKDVDIIPIEPQYRGFVNLPLATLTTSKHTEMARKIKEFILSSEAKHIFRSHAYAIDPGPLDKDGFCTDGGKASDEDCKWLIEAVKVARDDSIPINAKTCGPLIPEVKRQRKTNRAGD